MQLRAYQQKLSADIRQAWASGHRNVLAVLPTGGGKTVIFGNEIAGEMALALRSHGGGGYSAAIAHRQELVGQISLALARYGVPHRIVAPKAVIKRIAAQHVIEVGRCYYSPNAPAAVIGVDTLLSRVDELARFCAKAKLWVIDEAHHILKKNKWGKAEELFPNARGLGVTATPCRADGRGLGRHADGVFDAMVVGPTMRELINDGWLTDYRLFAPQSDVDLSTVTVSKATGDYVPAKLKNAIRKSHIIGDVVDHYVRIAPGKQGVVFASDVETATDMAIKFNAAGVKAEVVSAKTPDSVRGEIMRRYRRGDITILVNVDLFGEGFDLPAIGVVIMARPTESFGLFCQQFGRGLRPMDGKTHAIIIDHVGNITRHGLPDARQDWTLDARDKSSRSSPSDAIPLRNCLNPVCMQVYERVRPACPYCGSHPEPASRSAPEFVDGDLTELDPAVLAAMRGEVERVDMPVEDYRRELAANHCPPIGQAAHVKRHVARQGAQAALRASMAWWAGYHRSQGRGDAESYRRFWHAFGIDALSAQALNTPEALALAERVNTQLIDLIVNKA